MTVSVNGRFGFSYAIPYDRVTKAPLGLFQVIQEFNYEPARDIVKLEGGNAPGAFAAEMGMRENPLSIQLREFPEFALVEFEGGELTENAAEASGYFADSGIPTNTKGTSIVDAALGIASVTAMVGQEANIPFGNIIFKGTAESTKVDIYLVGKPEQGFIGDGALVASGVTIPGTGATVDVIALGITITGGSGSIAFTEGDIASLEVRGINQGSKVTVVGAQQEIREIGMFGIFPKRSDGSLVYIDFHRIMPVAPMPIKGIMREWADWTLNAEILVDFCNNNKLYTLYNILPDITC